MAKIKLGKREFVIWLLFSSDGFFYFKQQINAELNVIHFQVDDDIFDCPSAQILSG